MLPRNVINLSELILGFQRDGVPLAGCGTESHIAFKRSAKGEFPNSPQDYLERGKALQERAFPQCGHGTPCPY